MSTLLVVSAIMSLPFIGVIIYSYVYYFIDFEIVTRGQHLISAVLFMVLSLPLTLIFMVFRARSKSKVSARLGKITTLPFVVLHILLPITMMLIIIIAK